MAVEGHSDLQFATPPWRRRNVKSRDGISKPVSLYSPEVYTCSFVSVVVVVVAGQAKSNHHANGIPTPGHTMTRGTRRKTPISGQTLRSHCSRD